jgi:transposase
MKTDTTTHLPTPTVRLLTPRERQAASQSKLRENGGRRKSINLDKWATADLATIRKLKKGADTDTFAVWMALKFFAASLKKPVKPPAAAKAANQPATPHQP